MSDLVASLWITLIGMGLVFLGVLLLWGLMEAVVRVTARFARDEEEETEEGGEAEVEPEPEAPLALAPSSALKKRAAAVAVAVALAMRKPAARVSLPQQSGSGWQSVTRASQLNHPTHIARKSQGSVR